MTIDDQMKNCNTMLIETQPKVNRNNTIYYSSKEPFDFRTFKTIRSFGEIIYSGKITINEANEKQPV